MKRLISLAVVTLMLVIGGFGQDQRNGRNVVLDSGTRIDGELQSAVDVKRSKPGDTVVLKTTKSIDQNGKVVVPKGSRLIGRVTEVQQKTRANGQSKLSMVFDRIEGKNLSAPINASIMSIVNAGANMSMMETDVFASGNASSRSSSSSGGGSLLGGVTDTVGGVVNATTQTAGGITNAAGQTVGSTAGGVSRTVSGIQISNAVSGSATSGTTLSAADKNIRLEKGVMMQLRLNRSTAAE